MGWTVEVSNYAEKRLRKLDKPIQKWLLDWFDDRIEGCKNPRHFGNLCEEKWLGFGVTALETTELFVKFRISSLLFWRWQWGIVERFILGAVK